MAEFLSSPYSLLILGLVVLAFAIILLMIWIVIIDRRTRGVVDGLETERRKVAEMQRIVGQRQASRPGYAPARSASAQHPQAQKVQPQAAPPARSQQAAQPVRQAAQPVRQAAQQPGRSRGQGASSQQQVRTQASSAQQPKTQVQAHAEYPRTSASDTRARRQPAQPAQSAQSAQSLRDQGVRASRPSRSGGAQASSPQPTAAAARAAATRGSAATASHSTRQRASVSNGGYTQVPNQAVSPSATEGFEGLARPRRDRASSQAGVRSAAAQPATSQPSSEDRPRGRHAAR